MCQQWFSPQIIFHYVPTYYTFHVTCFKHGESGKKHVHFVITRVKKCELPQLNNCYKNEFVNKIKVVQNARGIFKLKYLQAEHNLLLKQAIETLALAFTLLCAAVPLVEVAANENEAPRSVWRLAEGLDKRTGDKHFPRCWTPRNERNKPNIHITMMDKTMMV